MATLNEILGTIKGLSPVNPPPNPPRRLLLQGKGGSGKTFGASTFPSPVWLEVENTLDLHADNIMKIHNVDIRKHMRIPFWNEEFVIEYLKSISKTGNAAKVAGIVNRQSAILNWMQNEAVKLPREVTLVIDSWTRIQEAFDHWGEANPILTAGNQVDKFAFYAAKKKFSEKISGVIEKLPCNVVVICHEMPEWADGAPTGKILPLQEGGFQGKITSYYPDVYRACFVDDKDSAGKPIVDKESQKKMGKYMWQTASGNNFDAKCSIVGLPAFVPAHYNSLVTIPEE